MPHAPHIRRWYCTAGWQRRRVHQLMIEPLCRLCLEAGRVTPATVADHVKQALRAYFSQRGLRTHRAQQAYVLTFRLRRVGYVFFTLPAPMTVPSA